MRTGSRGIFRSYRCLIAAAAAFACSGNLLQALMAQAGKQPPNQAMISMGSVPPAVTRLVSAAGDRFKRPDKARWTGAVELRTAPGGPVLAAAQLVMEWPGKLFLKAADGQVTLVPGHQPSAQITGVFADLAEILIEDSIDGFLYLQTGGGAVRQIGLGYRDPSQPAAAADVFSVSARSRVRGGAPTVAKQYWFDSLSGLLMKVVYGDTSTEVWFSDWVTVQANSFPTIITRFDDGQPTLCVTLIPQALMPRTDDQLFPAN